ncbi:16S rRNA (cytosine(967)-C(5))-methyltransferase RsmB [Diaphorobacter sp. HDW4A]|uniref:16S rRNA (cytosine(967)-C(5))-methyltransferase RsmB n=1 Tax=Diaphorobacter sp. HDW4A TaxID=2714924 RepID=UPI0014088355|nr:16S rRNA (cytosine(967)-C(5))-methyltransferase RsmB [Diaphorobacter sp. HDW4A]QIL83176.1 16S rRNA (cytosine(967)-C(5))-methyltransferase RsmB [Diaphorobacter sp. HDW4A]
MAIQSKKTISSHFNVPSGGGEQQGPALWKQLDAAAQCLQAVRGGQSATAVLEQVERSLRPGVQALLFQALRQLGRAQALRKELATRNPPPRVDNLLCTALALAWQDDVAPYPPFTLVSQAVEAAKRNATTRGQAGFVNACLRRFLRERDALVAATDKDPVAQWNHPLWWIRAVQKDYPEHWQRILAANNAHAPMTLRVNALRSTADEYLQWLGAAGMPGARVGAGGIELAQAAPVSQLPGFVGGSVSVQDAAAQLAAPLLTEGLDQTKPLQILDACAAPGGKTAHILELAGAQQQWQVTALEMDGERARRIGETLERLKLKAQVLVTDAGNVDDWWPKANGRAQFDAILLDAPCSAAGIVRRHPDVRWLRRESDLPQLAKLQERLLDALWPLLKPGGRLLYCTCSIFLVEGQNQIKAFLSRNTDAHLLTAPGHLMPGHSAGDDKLRENAIGDHDGFYYALLQKLAA